MKAVFHSLSTEHTTGEPAWHHRIASPPSQSFDAIPFAPGCRSPAALSGKKNASWRCPFESAGVTTQSA